MAGIWDQDSGRKEKTPDESGGWSLRAVSRPWATHEEECSAILNRSAARACHFWPAEQPRTFLRLAVVTLTIGKPLSAAASSVMASALIASMEDVNRPDDPRSAIVERRPLAPGEYDDETLQEFYQIGSGPRLKADRRDRLDHESLARACRLRDDHRVLGGAHSEDHPWILAEVKTRVKSRPLGGRR
jgi:hypothetical protein